MSLTVMVVLIILILSALVWLALWGELKLFDRIHGDDERDQ